MHTNVPFDETLLKRLPFPLAQLYGRAHNTRSALELHQTAYYLWEAALKLLASTAIVAYAERPDPDPAQAERLQNLARPSIGHWWEFVRRAPDEQTVVRSQVRLSELFDRLVQYRNREVGHGAVGQRPASFYERMGRALLAGVPELLERIDVLAGRQLVYVAEVNGMPDGSRRIERTSLSGPVVRRLEPAILPGSTWL